MPTSSECNSMIERFDSTIGTFAQDNYEFKTGYAKHNEMIRRYDEVITQKANKHTLAEEINKVNQDFQPKMHDLETNHTKMM